MGARENSRPAAAAGEDDPDPDSDRDNTAATRRAADSDRLEQELDRDPPLFKNPKPWETVVRIRVLGKHSTGFGSGTVIHSSPQESLILTCAHIFKLDGRKQTLPSEFPRQIMVDLFDGNLTGTDPAVVHFLEAVEGRAVDYDFKKDVGLIRIRPGRRLPASPRRARALAAPTTNESPDGRLLRGPGRDGLAYHHRPSARIQNFLSGNPSYEAIECRVAPKQGRSGGGLFTTDGYITGVCNFAEPQGNHGLYATPHSIYSLLDRNDLSALYAPVSRDNGTLLAGRRRGSEPRPGAPISVARSQSPEEEEPVRKAARADKGDVMIPAPSLVGIADPIPARSDRTVASSTGETRRTNWLPVHTAAAPSGAATTEQTDLALDPAADHDRFGPPPADLASADDASSGRTAPLSSCAPGKNPWRPKKTPRAAATADAGNPDRR